MCVSSGSIDSILARLKRRRDLLEFLTGSPASDSRTEKSQSFKLRPSTSNPVVSALNAQFHLCPRPLISHGVRVKFQKRETERLRFWIATAEVSQKVLQIPSTLPAWVKVLDVLVYRDIGCVIRKNPIA
ncbi:unnamed protein product [Linum trigynum]|uniref:Uncharacterized protein n=1 Tax=Linum trigynum TaxID=586398 RepID=A0AAV2GGT4_9ROSI